MAASPERKGPPRLTPRAFGQTFGRKQGVSALGSSCVQRVATVMIAGYNGIVPGGRTRVSVATFLALAALIYADSGPTAEFELNGLFTMGAEKYAAVRMVGKPVTAAWTKVGDAIGEYTVAEIRADGVVLRRTENGATSEADEIVVPLKHSTILASDELTAEAMSEEQIRWINSTANPMVRSPHGIPHKAMQGWLTLSAEERATIKRWYHAHGWKLSVLDLGEGFTEFTFTNLFEDYRARILEENKRRFELMMTDRQRELQERMRAIVKSDGPVRVDSLSEEDQAALRALSDEFQASLTPEQRQLRKGCWDFLVEVPLPIETGTGSSNNQPGGAP